MYLLQLVDWYLSSLVLLFICGMEVTVLAWVYGIVYFLYRLWLRLVGTPVLTQLTAYIQIVDGVRL